MMYELIHMILLEQTDILLYYTITIVNTSWELTLCSNHSYTDVTI